MFRRYIHFAVGRDERSRVGGPELNHMDHVRYAVDDRRVVLRGAGYFHPEVGRRLHVPVRRIRTVARLPLPVGRHARVRVRIKCVLKNVILFISARQNRSDYTRSIQYIIVVTITAITIIRAVS